MSAVNEKMINTDEYLTVREFADALKYSTQGVYALIRQKKITKTKRMGNLLIHRTELDQFKAKKKK